ncbi:MAG: hypothetical protein ACI4S3_05495 [Candidatus Gastranaerophilaceae bacterium]
MIPVIYKTPENFRKIVCDNKPIEVCRPPHYRFSDKVTSKNPKVTFDSNSCTIIGVNDTVFHLAPEIRELNVIDKFRDFLKSEKDKTGDITAFIFGARCPRIQKDSFQFAEDLRNVLEKENTDYSAIYGKTLDGFLDDLYQEKINLYLHKNEMLDLQKCHKKNNIQIQINLSNFLNTIIKL